MQQNLLTLNFDSDVSKVINRVWQDANICGKFEESQTCTLQENTTNQPTNKQTLAITVRLYGALTVDHFVAILCAGPSRATAGPGKPLLRAPITTSFHMRRDRGNAERGVTVSSPSEIQVWVWGAS